MPSFSGRRNSAKHKPRDGVARVGTSPRSRSRPRMSRGWRAAFANLSPWGYTKLLFGFLLFAGALIWAGSRWAYYSGFHLHGGGVDEQHDRWGFHDTTRLNQHVEQLDREYNLSMLQRRKAREIYAKRFVWSDQKDEWAKEVMNQQGSGRSQRQRGVKSRGDWLRKVESECNAEFAEVLTDEQLRKWKETHEN